MPTPPVCSPTSTRLVEPVVVLDDLVGHPPDRPPHVVGVHDLAPGNKNAPVGGRGASFAFGHQAASFLPSGPHGTRLTSDEDHSTRPPGHRDRRGVGGDRSGRRPSSGRGRRSPTPRGGSPAVEATPCAAVRGSRPPADLGGPGLPVEGRQPHLARDRARRARRPGRGSATARRRASSPAIQRSAAARSRRSGTPVQRWISGSAHAATSAGASVELPRPQARRSSSATAESGGSQRIRAGGSPRADLGGDLGEEAVDEAAAVVGGEALGSSTVSLRTTAVGTSGRVISSAVPMRRAARSSAGMRASVQPFACSLEEPVDALVVLVDGAHERRRRSRPAAPGARRAPRCRCSPWSRPRTAARGRARGRRAAPRRGSSGSGDVLAGAGVDLDAVARVHEQRHLHDEARSRAWPACGHRTRGRPGCRARSR